MLASACVLCLSTSLCLSILGLESQGLGYAEDVRQEEVLYEATPRFSGFRVGLWPSVLRGERVHVQV